MVMPPNMVVIGFDLSPYRLINNVLSLGSSPDFLRNVHTYHTNRKQTRHTTPYVLCTVSACLVEFVRHPTGSVAKAQLKKNKITSPVLSMARFQHMCHVHKAFGIIIPEWNIIQIGTLKINW